MQSSNVIHETKSKSRKMLNLFNIEAPEELLQKLDIKYHEWAEGLPPGIKPSKTAFKLGIFYEYVEGVELPES